MKRISLFGQAALLLLVCFAFVVAASLAYRKKLHAKRLDRILSFQSRRIDKCTVGCPPSSAKKRPPSKAKTPTHSPAGSRNT